MGIIKKTGFLVILLALSGCAGIGKKSEIEVFSCLASLDFFIILGIIAHC